jgi:N-methylhydantoinase B
MLHSIDRENAAEAVTHDAAPRVCGPVTLEILRGAIHAVQAEMEALLERTAISAFIREKKDFYTALFDADGVMAVGSNVPIFGDMTTPVFAHFPPDTMQPGDLYWYNDCYGSRGAVSHSNDQVLLAPVFHAGRRCAFVMGWAHFADIGGLRAGSISPDTTDIYQEGIIIPPTKLIDAGWTNEATLEIFHRNSRFPGQSRGDMRALMGSVELGARRVEDILARFGADVVADGLNQLLARTRRLVRTKLAETFAYGTHRFTDMIDSDGHGNGPFRIRLALTREHGKSSEDRFILDATETDDQSPGPVNLLMNPGVPGMALGLYYLGGDPGQVCNAGAAARGIAAVAALSRPAGHARPDHDAAVVGVERLGQRRGRRRPGGTVGLRDQPHTRHLSHRDRRVGALPAGRRHRCRLRRAAVRGRHRCGLFRRAGELSG